MKDIKSCRLKLIKIVLKDFNTTLGNRYVILLRYMNITMSHDSTEQMLRCIHFRHEGTEGVAEVMIFKGDLQFVFNLS